MSWWKLDDKAHSHAKTIAAGNAAFGLRDRLGSWCSDHGTDGRVPECVARAFDDDNGAQIARLLSVGLLEECDGGYQIHDFLVYNPSAAVVAKTRKARAKAGSFGGKQKASKLLGGCQAVASDMTVQCASKPLAKPCPDPDPDPDPDPRSDPDVQLVASVWEHFLSERAHYGSKSPLTLTPKRRAHLRARLRDSTVSELMAAADAMWASDWHRENGQTDPDLIYRSRDQVEKFLARQSKAAKRFVPLTGPLPAPTLPPSGSDDLVPPAMVEALQKEIGGLLTAIRGPSEAAS